MANNTSEQAGSRADQMEIEFCRLVVMFGRLRYATNRQTTARTRNILRGFICRDCNLRADKAETAWRLTCLRGSFVRMSSSCKIPIELLRCNAPENTGFGQIQRLVHRIWISDWRKIGPTIDTEHAVLLGSSFNQRRYIAFKFSQQPRSDVTI